MRARHEGSSRLRELGRRWLAPERRPEVDPGAPRRHLGTLDDWILFGPRVH